MSTLLYSPGVNWLHRAHPFTKLAVLPWSIVAALALPWQTTFAASLLMLALLAACGAGRVAVRLWLATIAPLAVVLVIVQGFMLHPPDTTVLHLALSRPGLALAALTLGRIGLLMAACLLVLATTHPSELLKALDAAGVSPGLSYLIASPLLIADTFAEKAREIRDAQQCRGLDIQSSAWTRLRTLPALIVPLVIVGLEDAQHRSQALTARAFRALPRRTVLDPPADSLAQKAVRWLLLAAAFVQGGVALWH